VLATTKAGLPLPGLLPVEGKPLIARFDGGTLSSDGGLLALREIEERLDVAKRLAACIDDLRTPERIQHNLVDMVHFRLLMMSAVYQDGNDADSLPHDLLFKLANGGCPMRPRCACNRRCRDWENAPGQCELVHMPCTMVAL
jgi:hypothetical protein